MVKIENQEIPDNKNISIALTSIYGIGRHRAKEMVKECAINPYTKAKNLTVEQIYNIILAIKKYATGSELKQQIKENIDTQIKIGSWKGQRKVNGLGGRGQRTRHNSQTAKKRGASTRKKVAVAGKKKAPSPK